jgi:hypothetical protein
MITPSANERTRSSTCKDAANDSIADQEARNHLSSLVAVVKSIWCEKSPSSTANVQLINTSLYHPAHNLNVGSPSFTSTVVHVAHMGLPVVYKPKAEFHLTLLQCGQILEDSAAKITKHYSLTDLDPYKFDPGGILTLVSHLSLPN